MMNLFVEKSGNSFSRSNSLRPADKGMTLFLTMSAICFSSLGVIALLGAFKSQELFSRYGWFLAAAFLIFIALSAILMIVADLIRRFTLKNLSRKELAARIRQEKNLIE